MHVEASLRDDAVGIVELGQLGEMRDVAGVKDEGRLRGQRLILLIASSSVPRALGLAALSKPTWLSLICRNVSPRGSSAAPASPMRPIERGTPPAIVHSTPVPAQVMHSRILRRLTPCVSS
jgi:hypothetical protein